jgi:hypothetical protein
VAKKKQEIFTEDYNTVSNPNKNLWLEWLDGTNAEEAGSGQYEWL